MRIEKYLAEGKCFLHQEDDKGVGIDRFSESVRTDESNEDAGMSKSSKGAGLDKKSAAELWSQRRDQMEILKYGAQRKRKADELDDEKNPQD